MKLGLIKLLEKHFDLCEEARIANATVQCPVESGSYTVQHTVALPREIPREIAKFTAKIVGDTVDDEDLFCLDFLFNFMEGTFL